MGAIIRPQDLPDRTCHAYNRRVTKRRRVPVLAASALLCLVSACARPVPQAQAHDVAENASPGNAPPENVPNDVRRIALPDPDPTPPIPADGKAVWTLAGETARFGVDGADPLLTLACRDHRLVITRPIAAEVGAGALFAIEGPKRIVRIAVDATPLPDRRGYVWQGGMDGGDINTDVFASPFTGTLPGGGLIKVSAGDPPREVVRHCRQTAKS